jgi:hypothetical protein
MTQASETLTKEGGCFKKRRNYSQYLPARVELRDEIEQFKLLSGVLTLRFNAHITSPQLRNLKTNVVQGSNFAFFAFPQFEIQVLT